jgi:hypothetical protein
MNPANDLLERMPDDELNKMILELGYYALKVSNEYHWRTKNKDALPKGETIESIVSQALEKVLTGERSWNRAQQPDFTKFMRDVIDSLINHLAGSKDNAILTPVPEEGSEDERNWHTGARADPKIDWLARLENTPEQVLLDKESSKQKDKALRLLLEECAGDQVLTKIVNAMLGESNQYDEIANVVGIEKKEVYNAMKRLDRKIATVRRKMTNGEGTPKVNTSRGGTESD